MSDVVIQVDRLWKKYRLGVLGTGTLRHDFNRWLHRLAGRPDPYAIVGQGESKIEDRRSKIEGKASQIEVGATLSPNSHLPASTPASTPIYNLLSTSSSLRDDEMWALRDISFEVKQGEILGIIGKNGAGKSTLLKILSRVTAPTSGEVRVKGRIASLLEVGTGFHPELTGRENIFLNGAILGMTKGEIKAKLDDIVGFSEVEKYIDTPVKRYSSGMYVRLAFAVAAHLDPEILIVDEVLAVGDVQFQKKCLGKMKDVSTGGRTVLFVSHNMAAVSTLTERCLYLQGGQIAAAGTSREIVELYLMKLVATQSTRVNRIETYRRNRNNDAPVKITSIRLSGCGNHSDGLPNVEVGSDFTIEVGLDTVRTLRSATLDITLRTSQGECVTVLFSGDQNCILSLDPGCHTVSARVHDLPLAPGNYFADVGINQSVQSRAYDVITEFPLFTVVNRGQVTHWLDRAWGLLHCQSVRWEVA